MMIAARPMAKSCATSLRATHPIATVMNAKMIARNLNARNSASVKSGRFGLSSFTAVGLGALPA